MKRDMDLVRSILIEVEKQPSGFASQEIHLEGYTDEQVGYHASIMHEAGLVHAVDVTVLSGTSPQAVITRLTWHGHEFLDAAREPTRWQQARDLVDRFSGAPIQVWTHVLTELVKRSVGL